MKDFHLRRLKIIYFNLDSDETEYMYMIIMFHKDRVLALCNHLHKIDISSQNRQYK